MYLCLSVWPFLTSRGLAEEHADTKVSDLIAALKDPDPIVRQGVAITLGGLRKLAAAAVPALIKALQDPEPTVRQNAAAALGMIGTQPQDVIPALIAAIKDSHPEVRRSAASALGRIHMTPSAPLGLVVRGKNPDPSALPALIAAMKDPNPDVRRSAADSLGLLGVQSKTAVPVLIEALKDLDPHTSSIVARALVNIAIAAQDAGATAMIAPLKAAHNALSDRGLHSQAQSVKRAIDFLELLWWKNLTEWLLRWIHEWSVRESAIRMWTDHCAKFSKRLC
jgi:HEAT repeat protein